MPQNRNKLKTTRRNSGSFIYPDIAGIGMSVGIASTAIFTNSNDIFFKGIHHLKQPVEGLVHVQGQGGGGGSAAQAAGGGGGGGGYIRAKIDSVNAKRFVATVTADATPPSGFWFSADNYIAFSSGKGSQGGNGGNDNDGGRGLFAHGGGGGGAGSGASALNPNISLFRVLQAVNGSGGSGGPNTHGDNSHHSAGPGGAGGAGGFKNSHPNHPLALSTRGNGSPGSPSPTYSSSSTPGFVIIESPGRPWNMTSSGNPAGDYNLS